ncbi:MAG: SDR family NAD(P)-dependent oxidoreductase [Actinomycetota bacterium]|nr:SDR family NAD(P)-dependent oxidoreductase [Actinomycetota bacterium]
MMELSSKVVVITGGASGIGLAMAERFAAEGCRLVLADVEQRALAAALGALQSTGAEVIGIPTDVSNRDQVHSMARSAIEHYGEVHILCNNAGVGSRGLPISELPAEDFHWLLGVNLYGVIHGLEAFLPHLRAHDEGHIVNTASIAGLVHLPGMGPYNASKAAVVALSETLAFELAEEGSKLGVSVLCPGWVRTALGTSDRNRPEALAVSFTTEQAQRVAARRQKIAELFAREAIEPTDVAEMVLDAIRERRFYVFTHPDMTPEVQARFDRIVAGSNPSAPLL